MNVLLITITILILFSYFFGKQRALAIEKRKRRSLHSLPSHYGYMTAMWCGLLLFLWFCFETTIIEYLLIFSLPTDIQSLSSGELSLVLNDIKLLMASGITDADTVKQTAAQYLLSMQETQCH